jgi:hypothetical protein
VLVFPLLKATDCALGVRAKWRLLGSKALCSETSQSTLHRFFLAIAARRIRGTSVPQSLIAVDRAEVHRHRYLGSNMH